MNRQTKMAGPPPTPPLPARPIPKGDEQYSVEKRWPKKAYHYTPEIKHQQFNTSTPLSQKSWQEPPATKKAKAMYNLPGSWKCGQRPTVKHISNSLPSKRSLPQNIRLNQTSVHTDIHFHRASRVVRNSDCSVGDCSVTVRVLHLDAQHRPSLWLCVGLTQVGLIDVG
ncbi:hypothetical protein F5B21DRAFT_483134 [Xylaria acuta]|nr:hypothetical protein F5B21DRAFT_483134 [Xylaria acuta]